MFLRVARVSSCSTFLGKKCNLTPHIFLSNIHCFVREFVRTWLFLYSFVSYVRTNYVLHCFSKPNNGLFYILFIPRTLHDGGMFGCGECTLQPDCTSCTSDGCNNPNSGVTIRHSQGVLLMLLCQFMW